MRWDGDWFLRAFDYFGDPGRFGRERRGPDLTSSHRGCASCAGVGLDDGAARVVPSTACASVWRPTHGIVLLQPAYSHYQIELGEISSYPPGYKENAGIFCHTNPWIMIARGDDRRRRCRVRLLPAHQPVGARSDLSEVHRCEPYVYAQMIAGRDAPTHGEAKNSWLTGTAAWNFVAITQWILGIRPEHDGLRIDPVLPAAWSGYTATRRFRGATYEIRVRKPVGSTGRVVQLIVNGLHVDGNMLPPAPAGTTVDVEAVLELAPVAAAG